MGRDYTIRQESQFARTLNLFLQIAVAYHNDPSDEAAVAVSGCINEFAQVDPGSFAFRYARDKRRGALIPLGFGTIDLVSVLDVMNEIQNFLECADLDFTHKRDAVSIEMDEARRLYSPE